LLPLSADNAEMEGGLGIIEMPAGLSSGFRSSSTTAPLPMEPIMEALFPARSSFAGETTPLSEASPLVGAPRNGPATAAAGPAAADQVVSRYEQAAWHVEDGIFGLSALDYSNSRKFSRASYLLHERVRTKVFAPAVLLALATCFFEVPLWCGNGEWLAWTETHALCLAPDGTHVWLGPLPFLPKLWSVVLEVAALAAVWVCVGLAHLEAKNHTDMAESRSEDYQIDKTRCVTLTARTQHLSPTRLLIQGMCVS
jgi:hypothetical protein